MCKQQLAASLLCSPVGSAVLCCAVLLLPPGLCFRNTPIAMEGPSSQHTACGRCMVVARRDGFVKQLEDNNECICSILLPSGCLSRRALPHHHLLQNEPWLRTRAPF